MNRIELFGLLIVGLFYFSSQPMCMANSVDSLRHALNAADNLKSRAEILNRLSESILDTNPDSAAVFAGRALHTAINLEHKALQAEAEKNLGAARKAANDFPKAREHYIRSLDLYRELDDQDKIGALYIDLALLHNGLDQKDKAIDYLSSALDISKSEADRKKSGWIKNQIGYINWQKGAFSEALSYYESAYENFKTVNDSAWTGITLNNIGTIYWGVGDYGRALNHFQQSLSIRQACADHEGAVLVLNNIGLVYQDYGKLELALSHHQQAEQLAGEIEAYRGLAYSQINLAKYYRKQQKYDRALEYLKKAQANYVKSDLERFLSYCYKEIGQTYEEKGNLKEAKDYYQKSLKEAKRIRNDHRLAIAQHALASVLNKQQMLNRSLDFAGKSLQLSLSQNYKALIMDNYTLLAGIHEQKQQYTVSLNYFKKAAAIKDSIFNEEKNRKVAEMQVRFDADKKEKENALLRKDNKIQKLEIRRHAEVRNFIIVICILIFLILALVFYRYKSQKRANKLLYRQNREIQQVNNQNETLIKELKHTLDHVKTLHGLLPICASCKKIRDDKGYWDEVEIYIRKNSEADFTHSICPGCMEELYPELMKE